MRHWTLSFATSLFLICATSAWASSHKCSGCLRPLGDAILTEEKRNTDLIAAMFDEFSQSRSTTNLENYFSEDFILYSNSHKLEYDAFKQYLDQSFKLYKAIAIKLPDLFAKGDKVAARFTCKMTDQTDHTKDVDVMAIFQVKDQKIRRWWELTYSE